MTAHRLPDATRLQGQFGRYQIRRLLATGGMAAVYLAHDPRLEREVALKVPLPDAIGVDDVLARFRQAARAVARLNHPNICPVYEADTVDGLPYLTMAYVHGKTVAEWLAGGGVLPPDRAVHLVRKIAAALEEAHRQGVIHRDVKSSNVMLNHRGEPFLIDFGLARRLTGDPRLTMGRTMMGSPAYMAPEQIRGEARDLTHACDIYGLGVVFYEILTGRLPFLGDSEGTLFARILTEQPRPPSSLRNDISPMLDRICLLALAKAIPDRYPTMSALIADLDAFLASGGRNGIPTPLPAPEPDPALDGWGDEARPANDSFVLTVDEDLVLPTPTPSFPPAAALPQPAAPTQVPARTVLGIALDPVPELAHPAPVLTAAAAPAPEPAAPHVPTEPVRGGGLRWFCFKLLLLLVAMGGAAFAGSVFFPQGPVQANLRTSLYPPTDTQPAGKAGDANPSPPAPLGPSAEQVKLEAQVAELRKEIDLARKESTGWKQKADEAIGQALKEEQARLQAEKGRDEATRRREDQERIANQALRAAKDAERTANELRERLNRLEAALTDAQRKVQNFGALHRDRKGWMRIDNPTESDVKYETRFLAWDGNWQEWRTETVQARGTIHHWYRGALLVQIRFDHTLNDDKKVWKIYDLHLEQTGDDRAIDHRHIRVRYIFELDQTNMRIDLRRKDFPN